MGRRRVCVFCGGGPVSAEHVWPKWLRQTPQGAAHYEARTYPNREHEVMRSRGVVVDGRPGIEFGFVPRGKVVPTMDVTVKVVCADCNNGWMSDLENAAKPTLMRLMAAGDEEVILQRPELAVLRRWIAKTAAMWQFNDQPTRTFKRPALQTIHAGLELPGTAFGMYRSSDPVNHFRLSHIGGPYVAAPQHPGQVRGTIAGHLSITAVGVHQVVLFVAFADGLRGSDLLQHARPKVPGAVGLDGDRAVWPPADINAYQWVEMIMIDPVVEAPG